MAGSTPDAKIRLRGVRKSFGSKLVLDGVDLDVEEGTSTVVIGGSGTGKSVLLKHMVALLRPDAGEVEVDGVAIHRLGRRELTRFRQRFGMAFQEGALFDSMSVADNVAFPLRRMGSRSSEEVRRRVEECLALVELEEAGAKMPSELSGGMRRRVGFARAIAHEPEILLFDEPTTGLDPVTKETIDQLINELRQRLDSTVVIISHDMGSVFRVADRIAMLYEGRVIAHGTPLEVRRSDDPRVTEFLRRDLEMWEGGGT